MSHRETRRSAFTLIGLREAAGKRESEGGRGGRPSH